MSPLLCSCRHLSPVHPAEAAPPCPEPGLLPADKDLTQKVTLLEVLRKQRLQLIRNNQEMSGRGEGSLSRGCVCDVLNICKKLETLASKSPAEGTLPLICSILVGSWSPTDQV